MEKGRAVPSWRPVEGGGGTGGRPQAELSPLPPLPPLVPGVCLAGVGIHPFPGLPQPQPIWASGTGEGVRCLPVFASLPPGPLLL